VDYMTRYYRWSVGALWAATVGFVLLLFWQILGEPSARALSRFLGPVVLAMLSLHFALWQAVTKSCDGTRRAKTACKLLALCCVVLAIGLFVVSFFVE